MRQRQPIFNLPGVVLAFVGLMCAIHLVRLLLPEETNLELLRAFAFVPGRFTAGFQPNRVAEALDAAQNQDAVHAAAAAYFLGDGKPLWWTPITYAFLHASWLHIGFNCLWLVAFGAAVARRFGPWRFVLFCLASAAAGAAGHYATHMDDLQLVIGASAVVSATMGAAVRFNFQPFAPLGEAGAPDASAQAYRQPALPLRKLVTDRRAMVFLIAWFFANLLFGIAPELVGMGAVTVAWQAHIGGFLLGLLAFPLFDPPQRDFAMQEKI